VRDDISQRVYNILSELHTLHIDVSELADDQDLYEAGLKSMAAVHLMLALEDEFGIEFADSALHRGAFATVARIHSLIEQQLALV